MAAYFKLEESGQSHTDLIAEAAQQIIEEQLQSGVDGQEPAGDEVGSINHHIYMYM